MPPAAAATSPACRRSAPVKAPLRWPNSVAENIASSKLAMLTGMYAPFLPLRRCTALAISSLPTPVSPVMSTVRAVGAAAATARKTAFIFGLRVMIREKASSAAGPVERKRAAASRRSASSRRVSMARFTVVTSAAPATGFTR